MDSRKLLAIFRKDFSQYFSSPMGYVVLFIYFFVTGFFFYNGIQQSHMASLTSSLSTNTFILLFLAPLITMRLWSEEEKSGTVELLRTSPLTLWEIVMGKYLAVCAFFAVMLIPSFIYFILLAVMGNPELGVTFANYVGFCLIAMTFFSLGLFCSTLSENQIVSGVIAYFVLIMLWVVGIAGQFAQGGLREFLNGISLYGNLLDFWKGVIDLTHVFYYASFIFFGLFLSVMVLEGKRD